MSSEFVWSLKNGDLNEVQQYVEVMGFDVNGVIDGRQPIHFAADYGQTEVIQYLLEKGANINSLDKHGISALLAAIWEGHTKSVKLLLEKGASKQGTTPDGKTYLEVADKSEIKQLLQQF